MAYDASETSAHDAAPIECYEFRGTYSTYYLTSYAREITVGGREYTPATITRTQAKIGTQEEKSAALEITLPFDHPMAKEYAYRQAPPELELTLIRCHKDNLNDTVTMWKGLCTSFTVEGRLCKINVPSAFSHIMQGSAPVPRYQAPCNHVLYDNRCKVDASLHQYSVVVKSAVDNLVVVEALNITDNICAGGMLKKTTGNESRMVIKNIGTTITVSYPFANLKPGDRLTLQKGCDHSLTTCKAKFNNGERFGGFPLVPDRNPFTSKL